MPFSNDRGSLGTTTISAAFINKIDEALGRGHGHALDQAVDGGYMDRNQYRSLDKSWQKIGTMLNRMIQRGDDLSRTAARSATLQPPSSALGALQFSTDDQDGARASPAFNPLFSILDPYFLYNCLMNPEESSSRIKLGSTNALGSAVAALGFLGARSSSIVLTPSGVG